MKNVFDTFSQVGIYGYTAYSASKFGLQGLAQSLQQEVIADDIHVTLIFPPDTDTPGFEEGKNNPSELALIHYEYTVPHECRARIRYCHK